MMSKSDNESEKILLLASRKNCANKNLKFKLKSRFLMFSILIFSCNSIKNHCRNLNMSPNTYNTYINIQNSLAFFECAHCSNIEM